MSKNDLKSVAFMDDNEQKMRSHWMMIYSGSTLETLEYQLIDLDARIKVARANGENWLVTRLEWKLAVINELIEEVW